MSSSIKNNSICVELNKNNYTIDNNISNEEKRNEAKWIIAELLANKLRSAGHTCVELSKLHPQYPQLLYCGKEVCLDNNHRQIIQNGSVSSQLKQTLPMHRSFYCDDNDFE